MTDGEGGRGLKPRGRAPLTYIGTRLIKFCLNRGMNVRAHLVRYVGGSDSNVIKNCTK